jgi:serine phosphatase RsbU (regulator of sigma subunit)/tetratricopeptide (TPR) repeat protein
MKKIGWLFLLSLLTLVQASAGGFKYLPFQETNDTTTVILLNNQAQKEFESNRLDEALASCQKALEISNKIAYTAGTVNSLEKMAHIYRFKNDFNKAQQYYFEALNEIEKKKVNSFLPSIYTQIGLLYRDQSVHAKALEYYQKALEVMAPQAQVERTNLLRYIALANKSLNDNQGALNAYLKLLEIYKKQENANMTVLTLRSVADIYSVMDNYPKTLECYLQILEIKKKANDEESMANQLNDIGFCYQHLQKYQQALNYFVEALKLKRKLKKPEEDNIRILRNIGVMYQFLGNNDNALQYFSEALQIAEEKKDANEVAVSCTHIASIYLGYMDYNKAEEYYLRSVKVSQELHSRENLRRAYMRLSTIYERTAKNKKALDYYKLYASINDTMNAEENKKLQNLLKKQDEVKDLEKELQKLFADNELNRSQLEAARLLNETKEKEVEMLKREKEFEEVNKVRERLEKEQALTSAKQSEQELAARLQAAQITSLRRDKEMQDLEIQQKDLEQKDYLERIQNFKVQQQLKEQLLDEEKQLKKLFQIILGLAAFVVFFMLLSFVYMFRSNRKLKQQQFEIEEKNKALNMQQTEILQQNSALEDQRKQILSRKEEIEKSYNNMAVISDIGQEITATLDLSDIIQIVYTHVSNLMSSDKFGIGILSDDESRVDYVLYIDSGERKHGVSVSMSDERIASWVVKNKQEAFMNDISTEYARFLKNLDAYKNVKKLTSAIICLPLMVKEKVIGIINVQSIQRQAYTQYHLDMLQTLASYVSIAIYNSNVYQSLKDANEIINETNKHMTDSIRYAQTIQQAVLPGSERMSPFLKDYFVIYRPKDIVSGDFYWFSNTEHKLFIAAVDCTGHGVPGAFMSMVGNDLLDEIVNLEDQHDPAEILAQLHQGIFRRLKQDTGKNDDGMDVCLCKIEYAFEGKKEEDEVLVSFAGAKRPFFYTDSAEVKEIKGSNMAIGGMKKNTGKHFQTHSIPLKKQDMVYLTTDGYIDQNNKDREKYGTNRFKLVLSVIQDRDLSEQQKKLNSELEMHMGLEKQRDDITVIGVRL